jgi:hypothetical protein
VRTKQNVILQRRYSHPVAPGWALPFEGWQALNRLPDHFNILRIIWAAAMLNFVTVTQL